LDIPRSGKLAKKSDIILLCFMQSVNIL